MRIFAAAIAALIGLVITTAVLIGLLAVFGGKELRHKTPAALLAAIPGIAADELRTRGHQLAGPLSCQHMPGSTKRRMRVSCSGTTTDRERVHVIGAAEDKVKQEYFTILVNGRPLVQNAGCLGMDCHPKKD